MLQFLDTPNPDPTIIPITWTNFEVGHDQEVQRHVESSIESTVLYCITSQLNLTQGLYLKYLCEKVGGERTKP